jgi:2,3-bisphosphoglycerate-independent phosphoglycerate mutase
MRVVIVRCEDTARDGKFPTLLAGAKLTHLHHLAQAGCGGVIRPRGGTGAIDRLQVHRACFGLDPQEADAAPGRCYAAAAGATLAEGEAAWCCELVTQHDGRILDPHAGRISSQESAVLIQALDDQLGSDTRRWERGEGIHHVLRVRDPALVADQFPWLPSPELLVGQPWRRHLPKGAAGEALTALLDQAARLLEEHPVNRVRVDLGENPANLLWLWGAVPPGRCRTFTDRTGLTGAIISANFALRGFARAFGLSWQAGPSSFEEREVSRLFQTALDLAQRHDVIDVHLEVATADPVERLCAMERVDGLLLKPLTERLPHDEPWRLLVAIDDREMRAVPFVAFGQGVPQQPVASLTPAALADSPLSLSDDAGVWSWLISRG